MASHNLGNEIDALISLHVIYKYENQFQTKTPSFLSPKKLLGLF